MEYIQFRLDTDPRKLAERYMLAERKWTPLIKQQNLSVLVALERVAVYTALMIACANIHQEISEEQICATINKLLWLWKKGFFVPSPEYPYTLLETLRAIKISGGVRTADE